MKLKKVMGLKKIYVMTVIMVVFRITSLSASNSKESEMAYFSGKSKFENLDYKGAIRDLTKAIQFDATESKVFFLRGMAYFNINRGEEAIKDFDVAIALAPKIAEYHFQKAIALAEQDDYKLAYREMNRAIEIDSKNAEYYFIRAEIEKELGYVTDAKYDYEKAKSLGYKKAA